MGFSHLSAYRPQQVVVKVVELVPVLCDHLEKTATYFQVVACLCMCWAVRAGTVIESGQTIPTLADKMTDRQIHGWVSHKY